MRRERLYRGMRGRCWCVRACVCIHVRVRVGACPATNVPGSRWREPLGLLEYGQRDRLYRTTVSPGMVCTDSFPLKLIFLQQWYL